MKKTLFIFRRDFRLEDNTGLIFALKNSEWVLPAFIFTPEQIENNSYRSDHCLQFMIESLEDLEKQLKKKKGRLYLFYGEPEKIVEKCIQNLKIDAVVVNADYTPYSRKRDEKIKAVCKKLGAEFHSFEDLLLHPIGETLKSDGKPYTVFTPYYRNASRLKVAQPITNRYTNYYSGAVAFSQKNLYKKILPAPLLKPSGGREKALKILKTLARYTHYKSKRDFPAVEGTTHLSPHLKFTTCSPREIYWALSKKLGRSSELIRSLYWRDFFTSIGFYFPSIYHTSFREKFSQLPWSYDKKRFKAWCEGNTGVPIVDAGMREMNKTGFMHNRVRMIAASFLIKDLHIDWRWGEKYFAQTLIDYDPAVNNGNWQWVASTGCDAQPYFRIFNPWSQSLKFDPKCVYIKTWIPELSSLPPKAIHEWYLEKYREEYSPLYPAPIVDHPKEAKKTLTSYRKLA